MDSSGQLKKKRGKKMIELWDLLDTIPIQQSVRIYAADGAMLNGKFENITKHEHYEDYKHKSVNCITPNFEEKIIEVDLDD